MKNLLVPARMMRVADLESKSSLEGDAENNRITLSFSSEEPVLRSFQFEDGTEFRGYEIIGHDEGEADLTRLASGRAALLTDHAQTVDSQVGIVEKAWIEERRGNAILRFGNHIRAQEILARVRDGEISGVSVGYEPTSFLQVGERDGLPVIRAHWRPYEITLCPVPADHTVGIGRSAQGQAIISILLKEENRDMSTTPTTPVAGEKKKLAEPKTQGFDANAERARSKTIVAMGRKFAIDDTTVDRALGDGTTVEDFQTIVLDNMESNERTATRNRNSEIGLTEKEKSNFSFMNAIRYLEDPNSARKREAAKFEIEVSRAAQDATGTTARGILIPADILVDSHFGRAQNVGTASAGGALVATEHLDGSFIGMLRKRSALTRLGVRTLTGLRGNIDIPRQTGGGVAYWVGEGAGPDDSELQFDSLALTPHTLAAAVPVTRRAMLQTSPDVEAIVRDDLVKTMALEVDRVGINGEADADAPVGMIENPKINNVDFATAGAPIWAEVVQMETEVAADDADVDGMKYLFNANMRGHLKSTPKVAGTAEFIQRGTEVNGYQSIISNNAPTGSLLFGNWLDFIIALWSGLDLTVDKSTLASSGGVYLRAFQDVDFGQRHGESFAYGRDYQ